jgi:hypothetical protein
MGGSHSLSRVFLNLMFELYLPLPRIRCTDQSLRLEATPTSPPRRRLMSHARYTRCYPAQSTRPTDSSTPTINNRHMLEPQLSSSRKRQRPEPLQPNEASLPVSKKQKFSHPSGSQPPAAFWDNLSKIWLTKRALRELDRRNAEAALSPYRLPHRRVHRPLTRNFLAESNRNCQTTRYTTDYLHHCEPRILKDIKLFARRGGPDLSDLRNVCIAILASLRQS